MYLLCMDFNSVVHGFDVLGLKECCQLYDQPVQHNNTADHADTPHHGQPNIHPNHVYGKMQHVINKACDTPEAVQ